MVVMHIFLFDIDGTLLSSGGAGKEAMEEALAGEFGVPAHSGAIPYSGRTDRGIVRDLFRLHGVVESPDNLRRFLFRYLHVLPACLARRQGRLMPGIAGLLERLDLLPDVAVGLLTGNIRDGARIKLDHHSVGHHFTFGGFGDDYHERDDVAREALAACQRHVGSPPDLGRLWVVGDTPLDVRCARAIGARVAAIATGWHSIEELAAARPDLLLADLADPAPLLSLCG